MSLFKRKGETPSDPENLGELNERLHALTTELADIPAKLAELADDKQSGLIHDGDYNIQTSWLTLRQQEIPKEIKKLRARVDVVSRNLAKRALNPDQD